MDRHLFFTWRSMNLTRDAVGLGVEPWRLSFLSRQSECIEVWKTTRTRTRTLQSKVSLVSRGRMLSQSVLKCVPRRPLDSLVHTAAVYAHSKNKWLRVSIPCWQKIQAGSMLEFHAIIRSPVVNLLCWANHVQNAYFGVACWNQIPVCQSTVGVAWRIRCHVLFVLNNFL